MSSGWGPPHVHPDGLSPTSVNTWPRTARDGQGKRCSGRDGRPWSSRCLWALWSGMPRGRSSAICPGTSLSSLPGRQRRLGQQAFRHSHPPGATRFCQAQAARSGAFCVAGAKLLADVGLCRASHCGHNLLSVVCPRPSPKSPTTTYHALPPTWAWFMWRRASPSSLADIPGIIEGPARARAWGHDFLRYGPPPPADPCGGCFRQRGRDPVADFEAINEELKQYSPSWPPGPCWWRATRWISLRTAPWWKLLRPMWRPRVCPFRALLRRGPPGHP